MENIFKISPETQPADTRRLDFNPTSFCRAFFPSHVTLNPKTYEFQGLKIGRRHHEMLNRVQHDGSTLKACRAFSLSHVTLNLIQGLKMQRAFSLVEMLMALLVASLLLAALAPVITKRVNESLYVNGDFSYNGKSEIVDIEYGGPYCNNIVKDVNGNPLYCEGEYVVPEGYNNITVTAIGAGGGGGAAPNAGYIEYTTAGSTNTFTVPAMVDKIEATIIEGGAGGGAGWVDPVIKGFAWTHSGTLNRSYVSTSVVSENVTNVKVAGSETAENNTSYAHGTAVLKADDIKYAAGGNVYVTMSGGGGGGGRGYAGTGGGGGAAYTRKPISITNGKDYDISVASGGKGHTCNGAAGCGGAASSFGGTLLVAGGGGGGAWGTHGTNEATPGENGGAMGVPTSQICNFADRKDLPTLTGGGGAAPGGQNAPGEMCNTDVNTNCAFGSNGGGSTFGTAGVYATVSSDNRHGQGYGAGGCGSGMEGCPEYPDVDAHPNFTGNGAPGFVAVEWLNYGNGGAGGGAASIIPLQKVKTTPGEGLTVIVGKEGEGGKVASIASSTITLTLPTSGINAYQSYIKRGDATLLHTSNNTPTACNCGACGGRADGVSGVGSGSAAGWVGWCWSEGTGFDYNIFAQINSNYPGFQAYTGLGAGNTINNTTNPTVNDTGGDGGKVVTPWFTCTPGKGSTVLGQAGGDATGYGCGGGGGYGLADGGKGSGGYARISWNMFWDVALNNGKGDYKYAETGAGGGGASGNAVTETVHVNEKQVIKIRIGAGGRGARIVNNAIVPATSGGTTIFGDTNFVEIKAGGGGGGMSPAVGENGAFINGKGGGYSNICSVGSTSYINNKNRCQKGKEGSTPGDNNTNPAIGGLGGDFTFTIKGKTYTGSGGGGGAQATEAVNSKGKDGTGIASGGGGAALLIHNKVENMTQLNYPEGGNGANGKIILQLWE